MRISAPPGYMGYRESPCLKQSIHEGAGGVAQWGTVPGTRPPPQWGQVVTGAVGAQQELDTCSRGESLVTSPGFFSPTVALLASLHL